MKRYVIERSIPGVGAMTPAQLKAISAASNKAVGELAGKVQWVHSHVAPDNTFCVYYAASEDDLREHSRLAGFPITRINPIVTLLDPLSGYTELESEND